MAKYQARLTRKLIVKTISEGCKAIERKGRYVGRIHLLPTWCPFDSEDADMLEMELFKTQGFIDLEKITTEGERPQVEITDDDKVIVKRGRPKSEVK
jgi:hypothetical protein